MGGSLKHGKVVYLDFIAGQKHLSKFRSVEKDMGGAGEPYLYSISSSSFLYTVTMPRHPAHTGRDQ